MDELALDAAEIKAYEVAEVQKLLANRHVQAAFTATEAEIHAQWLRSTTTVEREECWMMWQAFKKWQRRIRSDRVLTLTKE